MCKFRRVVDMLASIVVLGLTSSQANDFIYTYKVDMRFAAVLLQFHLPLTDPPSHLLGKGAQLGELLF